MAKYAMLVDLNRCVDCQACTVACQAQYGLEPDKRFTTVRRYEWGTYPDVQGAFVTTQCMHCDKPPCAEVCPTGASYKHQDGAVLIDESRCIGCRYCLTACPYDARVYDETKKVARKCSFCYAEVAKGNAPACVKTCMAGARIFGDLDNPSSDIAKAVAGKGVVKIAGTSIYYAVPRSLERSYLPKDGEVPAYVSAWQGFVQPAGKALLGGVAGVVVLAALANNLRSHGEKSASGEEGSSHD